mgnify:CR=1 FL=1
MTGERGSLDVPMVRRVLVAVDLGAASGRAVAIAGTIARRAGAGLLVLHAETFDAPAYFTRSQIDQLVEERDALHERAQRAVDAFAREHTDTPFDVVIDGRAPADAVLAQASSADLVVMGTHGRRGPQRWWLGSVAERVRAATSTPLLVVPEGIGDPVDEVSVIGPGRPEINDSPLPAIASEIARLLGAVVRREPESAARHPRPMPTLFVPLGH